MSAAMSNVYGPAELEALRAVFDCVCAHAAHKYAYSRNDIAQLIMALARDRSEIDVDHLVSEALASLVATADRQNARDSRARAFQSQIIAHNWSPVSSDFANRLGIANAMV